MTLCLICHAWQSHALCEPCVHAFAQPIPRCPTCALPLLDTAWCAPCAHHPSGLDRCIAAVDYAYPWSICIAALKFGHDAGLARQLARLMQHTPWAEPALEQAHRLIPMPLSPQRLQERGFNQALEFARHLLPSNRTTWIDAQSLQRLSHAHHQVGADRSQRMAQVEDSFWFNAASPQPLKGQRIVLIDDVMTTGATLRAAARVLRLAGAAHITALVLARTPAPWTVAAAPIIDNARHVQHRLGPS